MSTFSKDGSGDGPHSHRIPISEDTTDATAESKYSSTVTPTHGQQGDESTSSFSFFPVTTRQKLIFAEDLKYLESESSDGEDKVMNNVNYFDATSMLLTPQTQSEDEDLAEDDDDDDNRVNIKVSPGEKRMLDKIDIKQGQGVRGGVEGDSEVVIVRELRQEIEHNYCGSITSKQRNSDAESRFDLAQVSQDGDAKDKINNQRQANWKPGYDELECLSPFSSVRLDHFPRALRTNDVFALTSPSTGVFEVRTCRKDFIAGPELQNYLLDETNDIFEDESHLSMTANIGSPRPVFNVSAILFDAPTVTNSKGDAIQLYDKERKRYGTVQSIGENVAHVEVLKTGSVIMDVPLKELFPHDAAKLRCGQYVNLGEWVGMVREVEREVYLKLKDGRKAKLLLDDKDAEDTYLSYISGGKYSYWGSQAGDIYCNPQIPMYPGQTIKVDSQLVENNIVSFPSKLTSCFGGVLRRVLRQRQPRGACPSVVDAVIQKVEVSFVQVIWVEQIAGGLEKVPPGGFDKKNIKTLHVLGPASQNFCEIGSLRIHKIKEGDLMTEGGLWKKEMAQRYGGTADLRSTDTVRRNTPFAKHKKLSKPVKLGDEVVVRVLLKYRTAEVLWEDGVKENIEMPKILQMIHGEDSSELDKELLPINFDISGGSSSVQSIKNQDQQAIFKKTSPLQKDTVGLPSIGISFKVNDFVVDALYPSPAGFSVYGIVRKIFASDFMLKIDWFEVDENFRTSKIDSDLKHPEVSVFDVRPMFECNDPDFRILWKTPKHSYSSEILCSRSEVNMLDFKFGFMTGIGDDGKVIARTDETTWSLWPCEIVGLEKACYQDELGEWKLITITVDSTEKAITTSYQQKKIKQMKNLENGDVSPSHSYSFPRLIHTSGTDADDFPPNPWESIENFGIQFPQIQIDGFAPKCHQLYNYFDELGGLEKEEVREKLKNSIDEDVERVVTLGLPEGCFIRGYEDCWNLFSVLMAAPKRSIYHGALFIFDIAIPENFPVDHPIVSYVSYATKLNPILKDQDFSVRPFSQCLTQTKHNLNNGNSSPSNSEIRPEGSLHDVITSIYNDLFLVSPAESLNALNAKKGQKLDLDDVPIYNAFLRGRVLESLSNFIDIPHQPWENFIQYKHLPEIQRVLLDAKIYLDESLASHGNRTPISESGTYLPPAEGIRTYIRNRMKYFV